MRLRTVLPLMLLSASLILAGCNLGQTDEEPINPTPTTSGQVTTKPSVTINSPQSGDSFPTGREILVSASASDAVGVTRVQLFANGRIVKTVSSEAEGGERQKNVVLDYTPDSGGDLTLRVIAYRNAVPSDPAEITVNISTSIQQPTSPSSQNPGAPPTADPNDPTCRFRTITGLNFRTGPSTQFDVITTFAAGTVVPIVGRLGDNTWWQVRSGSTTGWVAGTAQFGTVLGNCSTIPIIPSPPTPTGEVTATLTPTTTPTLTATPPPTDNPTATPGTPDLIVTSFEADEEAEIASGDDEVIVTFAVTVSNNGTDRTGDFRARLEVLGEGNDFTELTIANLRAGESWFNELDLEFDAPGQYTVRLTLDIDDTVDEISEANNTAVRVITITEE